MIENIKDALSSVFQGRTAYLGIGNTDRGDDGAGVELARRLDKAGVRNVFDGGIHPESRTYALREGNFDTIVFLDAVDAGAEPGSIVLLETKEIISRYPQVSTHKISMGTLAQLLTTGTHCRVWLLGIQPRTIEMYGKGLSSPVDKTVHMLAQGITEVITVNERATQEQVCN